MKPADDAAQLLELFGIAHAGRLVSHSPIDGAVIGRVTVGDPDARRRARRRSVRTWRKVPAPRRGELVRLLGEELRQAKPLLAKMVTLEAGKIMAESLGEVQEMIDICDFAVGPVAPALRPHDRQRAARPPDDGAMASARAGARDQRVQFSGRGVGVERGAGAGVRQSRDLEAEREDAALRRAGDAADAARAFRRFGDAPEWSGASWSRATGDVGEALVDDPRIALVSATGSTAMGRDGRRRVVAKRFGRSLLELGGNNAAIVCPSADLELADAGDPVLGGGDGGSALHDAAAADRRTKASRTSWSSG